MIADTAANLVMLAMIFRVDGARYYTLQAVPMDGIACEARLRQMPSDIVAECMPLDWWREELTKPRCRGALCRQPQ